MGADFLYVPSAREEHWLEVLSTRWVSWCLVWEENGQRGNLFSRIPAGKGPAKRQKTAGQKSLPAAFSPCFSCRNEGRFLHFFAVFSLAVPANGGGGVPCFSCCSRHRLLFVWWLCSRLFQKETGRHCLQIPRAWGLYSRQGDFLRV